MISLVSLPTMSMMLLWAVRSLAIFLPHSAMDLHVSALKRSNLYNNSPKDGWGRGPILGSTSEETTASGACSLGCAVVFGHPWAWPRGVHLPSCRLQYARHCSSNVSESCCGEASGHPPASGGLFHPCHFNANHGLVNNKNIINTSLRRGLCQ